MPTFSYAYLLEECEASRSLARKLLKQAKPGALIMLTKAEMYAWRTSIQVSLEQKELPYFDDNLLETGE